MIIFREQPVYKIGDEIVKDMSAFTEGIRKTLCWSTDKKQYTSPFIVANIKGDTSQWSLNQDTSAKKRLVRDLSMEAKRYLNANHPALGTDLLVLPYQGRIQYKEESLLSINVTDTGKVWIWTDETTTLYTELKIDLEQLKQTIMAKKPSWL